MSERSFLPPGSVVGILGGGQLGRMLALAAYNLGYRVHGYCPDGDTPLSQVTDRYTLAGYADEAALAKFAAAVDVVTFEFENVPAATVGFLRGRVPVRPNGEALAIAQDRWREKNFLKDRGIPTTPFARIESTGDLIPTLLQAERPAVLKTMRLGYDGKGQVKIDRGAQLADAWETLGRAPAILEDFVDFDRELSILVARGMDGATATFPLTENRHVDHILATSTAPAVVPPGVAARAREIAERIVRDLDYVGILGIEFFLSGDRLMVNELAPRVHNSGHWTIEGAVTSQFEQHIRAVCGLPLGQPRALFRAEMTNLIGADVDRWPDLMAQGDAHLHLYGKGAARPGRKMGHVTRLFPLGDD